MYVGTYFTYQSICCNIICTITNNISVLLVVPMIFPENIGRGRPILIIWHMASAQSTPLYHVHHLTVTTSAVTANPPCYIHDQPLSPPLWPRIVIVMWADLMAS